MYTWMLAALGDEGEARRELATQRAAGVPASHLAALAGDRGSAASRYRQAIELEERAGARIWATHHRLRLAETLRAGDDTEAAKLLERVRADAARFGLSRLADHAAALAGPNALALGG
jgi:hypothetical protein